jgi:phosphoglycolate phosphatase
MGKRGLIAFDLDGTLVDSRKAFRAAIHDYSAQNGLPPPDMAAIMRGYAEPHNHDFGWGVDRAEQSLHFDRCAYLFDNPAMYPAYSPGLFPQVRETLAMLELHFDLVVATARPMTAIDHIFKVNDIGGYFRSVRSHDDVAARGLKEKPEPDMLLDLMRELGVGPGETYMVGDTVMDMRMANAAGVHSVAVEWGFHPVETLLAEKPRHLLKKDISTISAILPQDQSHPPRHP